MSNTAHPTWGGSRPGSGRPKTGNTVITARLPKAAADKIRSAASDQGLTIGDYIVKALNL